MAVLQRVFLAPNERFDTPDARALEAFTQNDFRFMFGGMFSAKSYVMAGFDVSNYSQIFLVPGFKLRLSNVVMIHPEATTQAAGFYVFAGDEPDAVVSLSPNATNFIEVDFTASSGTPDVRALWDPAANANEGGEYTQTVDTAINLNLQIYTNASGFTPGRVALYKVVTNSSGIVTSLTDCRPMFFRLGAGGTSPDPTSTFQWPSTPDSLHARLENSPTATAATSNNQPFQGGDKNLKSFKDWMDAVMTSLLEIKGSQYWYSPVGAGGLVNSAYQNAAMTLLLEGTWVHLTGLPTGRLRLIGGSTVKRLGQSDGSMLPFSQVDLSTLNSLYILLEDSSLTYGMGQDGATPIVPKAISSTSPTGITVALGGNYATGGGRLMVDGQTYSYTSYSAGTGLFSGVSPDPTISLNPGDLAYQLGNAGVGYYHTSLSADAPSRGTDKVYWLAVYDGISKIQLRNGDLEIGERLEVSDNTTQNLLDYVGSTGEADDFPVYGVSTIPDGTNLTLAIKTLYQIIEAPVYEEPMDVVAGAPANSNEITAPVISGTLITLPLNSRAASVQQFYKNGSGVLQLFLNGQYLRLGDSWLEVGAPGSLQSQVQINTTLVLGDSLQFRHSGVAGSVGAVNPIYDEPITVVSGAPADLHQITGPVISGTIITIPLNSRGSDSLQNYKVGSGDLQVFLNGQYLNVGDQWIEVGVPGTFHNTIQINQGLVVGDILKLRINGAGGGAGGGGGTLQDAYAAGRSILTTLGNPVEISGPIGDKLLKVNGDVDVTGVIDPKGITFDQQASDPLPIGSYGFWVNTLGHVIQKRGAFADVDITAGSLGTGTASAAASGLMNNTGGTLLKLHPIRIDTNGDMALVDVSVAAQAEACIGVLKDNVLNGGTQDIITSGRLENIITLANFGDVMYVDKFGFVQNTPPTEGLLNFVAGDFVIRVGVVCKNQTNPLLKDLLVSIALVGQL